MKKALIILLLLAMAGCWMAIIYKLSDMNTQKSNGKSTDIIALFIEDTLDVTNEYGITSSHPDESKLAKASKLINAPMRKVMHASVYMVLAFFIILLVNVILNNKHYWIALIITLMLCVGFAVSDEYHQTHVTGRTGQALDVCIDTAGSIVGAGLYTSYYIVYKNGFNDGKRAYDKQRKLLNQ